MPDSKERFSNRVAHYARSRPEYPQTFYDFLRNDLKMTPSWTLADVGCGTGISTRPPLENGNTVYGIEPNGPMRAAAETFLASFPNFRSVNAAAEVTTLPDRSIDLILAAQAFHWFDKTKARIEFARILKPGGTIVLVWNERRLASASFLRDYEQLLQGFNIDYNKVRHENVGDPQLAAFFAPMNYQSRRFDNVQRFNYEGLESRLLSSSYTPPADDPRHAPMLAELRKIFDRNQNGGLVDFEYDTRAFFGRLA